MILRQIQIYSSHWIINDLLKFNLVEKKFNKLLETLTKMRKKFRSPVALISIEKVTNYRSAIIRGKKRFSKQIIHRVRRDSFSHRTEYLAEKYTLQWPAN